MSLRSVYQMLPTAEGQRAGKVHPRKRSCNGCVRLGIPALCIFVVGVFLWKLFPSGGLKGSPSWSSQKWREYEFNPVLPDEEHSEKTGTVFDLGLWLENMTVTGVPADLYYRDHVDHIETAMTWRMWNSWRPKQSIGYSTSVDGRIWNQELQISLPPGKEPWDADINRPFVKKIATGRYAMWYTGQAAGPAGGKIGYAESRDGIKFERVQDNPVLDVTLPWEDQAVMTPSIIDLPNGALRMYYAGGEQYEPDAIGIAHSYDGGLTWVKYGDPIFKPDRTSGPVGTWFDSHKVTSPHVIWRPDDGYYYLFYAGFRNTDYSSVGLARSKDGISGWERYVDNPIVDVVQGSWNCDAVYKPFAGWTEERQEWLVWYNGRCGGLERIGVSILNGKAFGRFVKRPED